MISRILTLYDFDGNGKTGGSPSKGGWTTCILKFEDNDRVDLANISIQDGQIYHSGNKINMGNYGAVIFNYGEDFLPSRFKRYPCMRNHKTYDDFIKYLVALKYAALKSNNSLLIYNDPENQKLMVNSRTTYETFSDTVEVNVPSIIDISSRNIDSIQTPVILTKAEQSGGCYKYLCKDTIELIRRFKEMEENCKEDVFCCDYLNSYIDDIGYKACIRFFIINNKLIYYLIRPSKEWNIHAGDQCYDKEVVKKAYNFLSRWIVDHEDEISKLLNYLYGRLGYGLYCHDFLLQKDKLFLCELGYKSYDHKTHKLLNKHSIKLGCLHENKDALQQTYRQEILTSIKKAFIETGTE